MNAIGRAYAIMIMMLSNSFMVQDSGYEVHCFFEEVNKRFCKVKDQFLHIPVRVFIASGSLNCVPNHDLFLFRMFFLNKNKSELFSVPALLPARKKVRSCTEKCFCVEWIACVDVGSHRCSVCFHGFSNQG